MSTSFSGPGPCPVVTVPCPVFPGLCRQTGPLDIGCSGLNKMLTAFDAAVEDKMQDVQFDQADSTSDMCAKMCACTQHAIDTD